MIRILKNECSNFARAASRTVSIDACEPIGYDMEVPDLDLNCAFDTLSADERLAITLFYFEGYSTREIAKICEVSDGTVRSRLSRAREALRRTLSEQEAAQ